jgi:hypothetical protein
MDARKNLARALQAFAAAFPRREERPLLFNAGVGAASRSILESASRLGLGDDIVIRQARYPDELMALLGGALWGMYLSLYEGFGLPPSRPWPAASLSSPPTPPPGARGWWGDAAPSWILAMSRPSPSP